MVYAKSWQNDACVQKINIFLILKIRRTEAYKLASIAAVSFLWSEVKQKDLAESGTQSSFE